MTEDPDRTPQPPKSRLDIWLAVMALLAIFASGLVWAVFDGYEETLEQEYRALETQAHLGDVQIAASLRSLDLVLQSVIDDIQAIPKISGQSISQRKQSWLRQFPEIHLFLTVDSRGQATTVESLDNPANIAAVRSFDASEREYFTFHRDAPPQAYFQYHLSRPFKTITNLYTISLSKAIRGPNGKFEGVAVVALSTNYFESILRQVIASDRLDAAAIHNRHGDIVYRLPDPDKYMGKNIAGGAAFKLYLDSPQHFTRYSGVTVTDKDRRVLVFSKVNGADLDIAVSGRYDDVMKSWRMNVIWKALLFVVVAVLALTLAWEIQRRLAERKLAEETIHQLAFNDTLTKLPNRRLLSERLNQSMVSSQRSARYGALMFMDLDNLKPLNDTYGHDAGDALLVEVANRLVSCVRAMDTVARFGGDEFVVLLRELAVDKTESSAQAAMVAEKIRAILAEPYVLSVTDRGNVCTMVEHHSSASIGVVLFRNHEASQDDILRWADDTMYQAKDAGRNVVRFFEAPGQT